MEHDPPAVGTCVSDVADRIWPTHKQLSRNSNQIKRKRETILSDSPIMMLLRMRLTVGVRSVVRCDSQPLAT